MKLRSLIINKKVVKYCVKNKISLYTADLRGTYLRGADLRGTYLRGADLRGADYRGEKTND